LNWHSFPNGSWALSLVEDDYGANGTFSPAVPELSTRAMLLLGFAGLGFAGHIRTSRAKMA
jgi:hypothetical protein